MHCATRVVDAAGKQYLAFSARFAYLEVFPIGADGRAEVFAGNAVFFHLDPATASAYPERRHDPVYVHISIPNAQHKSEKGIQADAQH